MNMDNDRSFRKTAYVLDTNVLIHDPNSLQNFQEHQVIIPMTVLEELDKLKDTKQSIAADCRSAIRMIDKLLGDAPPEAIEKGIPIRHSDSGEVHGSLSIMLTQLDRSKEHYLPDDDNDNRIINRIRVLQKENKDTKIILVTKDINMRLKARGCGIESQDYQTDQLVSDIRQLTKGYVDIPGSFWDLVSNVKTIYKHGSAYHTVPHEALNYEIFPNQFVVDQKGFVGRVTEVTADQVILRDLPQDKLLHQTAWGLKPRNIYQGLALHLLLDPEVHLVTLTGAAGSGKTILALAAAIELTVENKLYNKIIATRSTPPLAEDHGFLPGTEEEKMDPWLGAINDNIEALHLNDANPSSSIEFVKKKANIQFKALNYIRGRSFQRSFIIIDECQNLTPYQVKAIITRAGEGSKVVGLGNLSQIDTPYLNATSSGLTYMTERFKGFAHGGSVHLSGVPRSILAEYAESHL